MPNGFQEQFMFFDGLYLKICFSETLFLNYGNMAYSDATNITYLKAFNQNAF